MPDGAGFPTRIVVGVDGSPESEAAVAWAGQEAGLRRAELIMVNSVSNLALSAPGDDGYPLPPRALELAGEHLLQAAELVLAGHDRLAVYHRVAQGPAAPALLAEAARGDLLVLGTRGHGGFAGLLLGSTSYACIHHSPCPVVLLRRPGPPPPLGAGLVVGVDRSAASVTALAWAIAEARRRRCEVTALSVWDDPYTVVGPPPPVWVAGDEKAVLERSLEDSVARAFELSPGESVTVHPELRSGHPAEVLVEAARGSGALVVGAGSRSGVRAALVGSVSHRCAQLAVAPVVIVRGRDTNDHDDPGRSRAGE